MLKETPFSDAAFTFAFKKTLKHIWLEKYKPNLRKEIQKSCFSVSHKMLRNFTWPFIVKEFWFGHLTIFFVLNKPFPKLLSHSLSVISLFFSSPFLFNSSTSIVTLLCSSLVFEGQTSGVEKYLPNIYLIKPNSDRGYGFEFQIMQIYIFQYQRFFS